MIHDENDVLTDDELVVARNFFKKSKHECVYIRNEFPRGFCVKQKMTEEKKKLLTVEKHPGCVAHGHKLAGLMKKRKQEVLCNKEQSTYSLQKSLQYSLQYSQMELLYMMLVYLLSLPLEFVYFLHMTLFNLKKKSSMKNRINHQNDVICFRKIYNN